MELGREHPDPAHPSSFALDLEEEEEEEEEEEDEEGVEQNSDVMGVMNMEEKVWGGASWIRVRDLLNAAAGTNLQPSSHPFTILIIPPY